jgi:methylated-DNA-[protein]-cysteine S-methyltransferase
MAKKQIAERAQLQTRIDTPLGPMLLARSDRGVVGAWFDGQKYHPGKLGCPEAGSDDAMFAQTGDALVAIFEGRQPVLPPLDLAGTDFELAVWNALGAIALGNTSTYSAIAILAGRPGAARAAGSAIGRNPASLLVPCHRVLAADGGLAGYAGGLQRKRALLSIEKVSLKT